MNDLRAVVISGLKSTVDDMNAWEVVVDQRDKGQITDMKARVQKAVSYFEEPAVWHYYVNDEGKPRWKCSNCGKIARRRPDDKRFCSSCSKPMVFES